MSLDKQSAIYQNGNTATYSIDFSSTPTGGSTVVLTLAGWINSTNSSLFGVASCTDNQGPNTYTSRALASHTSAVGWSVWLQILTAHNVNASGTFTVSGNLQ